MGKRKQGRPTLLTKRRREAIIRARRLGCSWRVCAGAAGIEARLLLMWRRRGERERAGPYRKLVVELGAIEFDLIAKQLESVDAASADGDWKAAAWRLERLDPDEYGKNARRRPDPITADEQATIADPPALTLDVMGATWIRALQVAEKAYKGGELEAAAYLRTVTSLSGLAGRAIEIASRQIDAAEVAPLAISVSLDSAGVLDNATTTASLPGPCGDDITIQ